MCVIIELLPGIVIPSGLLENAINNNEDGYGLVVKEAGKDLRIFKACPKNGTKLKEVEDLLQENVQHLRYLHLRHKTEGSINLDNCHPYTVYDEDGIQIEFMHNGTLYEYRPQGEIKDNKGIITHYADPRSDSKIFCDRILIPMFKELKSPDYTTEFVKKFLGKIWPMSGSRGLIISNKFPTLILTPTDWKMIKVKHNEKEYEIRVSNDEYFFELKRGRVFEEKKRQKEAAVKTVSGFQENVTNTWSITRLSDVNFKANDSLTEDLLEILNDYDLYTNQGVADLDCLRVDELEDLTIKAPKEAAALIGHITSVFADLLEDFLELKRKHERASKIISDLKGGKNVNQD